MNVSACVCPTHLERKTPSVEKKKRYVTYIFPRESFLDRRLQTLVERVVGSVSYAEKFLLLLHGLLHSAAL